MMQSHGKMLKAAEAIKTFRNAGLSETTFHTRVRDGEIHAYLPEERKRGALYPEQEVLTAIARTKKTAKKSRVPIHTALKHALFMQATTQDMPEMAVLLELFYNARISVPKRAAWIERNPRCAYILRTADDHALVGCAFIMPLSEEKIFEILSSQVKPPTRPHEIELYEPGSHYSLYVRAAGVLQTVSKAQRRYWAAVLIMGLARAVIELGSQGIYIDKVYAQGDTRRGAKALKMLGFMQIVVPQIDPNELPTKRKNFMLDVMKSGSHFAMRYKYALNDWRDHNEEE